MKRSRVIVSAALALALVGGGSFGALAFADEPAKAAEGTPQATTSQPADTGTVAQVNSKEEVVYAKLGPSGSPSSVYVVNEFDVAGAGTLTDYGDYSSTSNLTSTNAMKEVGDRVTTTVDPGEFYYQGTLSNTNLPWLYNISYTLDGKQTSAKDVAGKSGALQIHLTTKKNPVVDSSFYDNYMQQITITLDNEKCSNIKAEGTTIANSGKDKVITATVMPGKNGDVTVSADVRDFEMSGIQIAALPFSMPIDLSGTDDVAGQMTPLVTGVASLNEGMQQLAAGSKAMSDGFNSSDISFDTSSFKQLSQGLRQMSQGLTSAASYLETAKQGFDYSYYSVLSPSINALPSAPLDTTALDALVTPGSQEEIQLNQLKAAYAAGLTTRATFNNPGMQQGLLGLSQVAGGLTDPTSQGSLYSLAGNLSYMADEIDKALDSMDFSKLQQLGGALKQLSDGIQQAADGVSQLNDGVSTLPSEMQAQIDSLIGQYDKSGFKPVSFTSPSNPSPSLVQFVITSDGVQMPKAPAPAAPTEETPTLVDKFLGLFK